MLYLIVHLTYDKQIFIHGTRCLRITVFPEISLTAIVNQLKYNLRRWLSIRCSLNFLVWRDGEHCCSFFATRSTLVRFIEIYGWRVIYCLALSCIKHHFKTVISMRLNFRLKLQTSSDH